MARATVGGTVNDTVWAPNADGWVRVTDASLMVRDATTKAPLTDLLLNGNAVTRIPVPKTGMVPVFSLPDGVIPPVEVSTSGRTWYLLGTTPFLVLDASTPVPPGTPPTIVLRRS